jgi:hypothetical protein
MDPPLHTREQMPEFGMEIFYITGQKKKKLKTKPSAGKVMLTVFWDSQGPVLEHYQEKGTTVNGARYSEMLHEQVETSNSNQTPRTTVKRCC